MRSKHTFLFFFLTVFALCSLKSQAQYITTFAGTGSAGFAGNGSAAISAELNSPTGIATYGYVTQYIADQANHVVRKVDYHGIMSTFAGNCTAGYKGDDSNATSAELNRPFAVAVDGYNNVYIADYAANVVRMVNTSGIITTVAGSDSAGYRGDGGPATNARLNHPCGLALDVFGNLFIADAQNNVVRKVNTSGMITTYAGNGKGSGLTTGHGGYSGDGGHADTAELNFPEGLAADVYGNLFIADESNNVIRKVNSAGIISTYAGNGYAGSFGEGVAASGAELYAPTGVAVDGPGNVYIADQGNNVIRKVSSATGIITTIAGNIASGYSGDGGLAASAQLNHPAGLAVDGNGLVYVADYGNNVIRLLGPASILVSVKSISNTSPGLKVYPNPSNGSFIVEIPGTANAATVNIIDVLGRVAATRAIESTTARKATFDLKNLPSGSYMVKVTEGGNIYREQLQIAAQ